jgi:hypothetical protein
LVVDQGKGFNDAKVRSPSDPIKTAADLVGSHIIAIMGPQ